MDLSFTVYSKTGKGTRALSSKAKDLPNGALKVLPLIDGKTDAAAILGQLGKISEIDFRILLSQLEASGYIRSMHKQTWDTQESDIDAPSGMGMVVEELFPDDFFHKDAPPDTDAEQATRQARAEAEQAQRQARQAEEARLKAETEAAEAKRIALAAHKARETEAAARRQAQEEAQRAALEGKRQAEEEARARAEEAAKLVEAERTAREKAERAAEEARVKAEAETKAREEAERVAREERKAREAEEAARRQAREEAERAALAAERKAAEDARIRAEEAVKLMAAERAAREQAERAAEEARIKAEAEAKAREEAERSAREERKAREAEEVARRQAQEEAERAAQEAQRKAAEDARVRAEEAAKLVEAERTAREKAERAAEQARIEAEQTALDAQRKAEDEARTRAEEAARLETERLAREQAERAAEEARAKAETEAKAREEAERSALEERKARIVEEAARRQAQEDAERIAREQVEREAEATRIQAATEAKAQAEETARIALEQQQVRETEEVRRRQEAETKARERQAREAEQTRLQAEAEAERKAQQEAERQARKAEEARLKAEADAAKRRAKEEARQQVEEEARQKLARKEQERTDRRARKIASALAKRNAQDSGRGIASTIKSIALYLPLFLILLIGVLHFINLAPLGAPIAKIASDSLGEPVQFGGLRASLFPQPQLALSDVTIGPDRDMKLGSVTVTLMLSTLFDNTRSVDRLEIMDASLDVAGLERPRTWFATAARAGKIRIAQVSFKKVMLAVPGLAPQPFDGRIALRPDGEFDSVELNGAERQLTLQLTPDGGHWKIAVDASGWQPPLRTTLKFDELQAEGTITGQKASFDHVKGRIYGGTFTGRGVIDWSARPRAYGSFEADNLGLPTALTAVGSAAKVEGSLQTTATFTTSADEAERLLEEIGVNAKFTIADGRLGGVDLASAMLPANREKSTRFDQLTGNLQLNKGVYHYRNLLLTSQQFNARGSVDVQENSALAGRISAELTIPSRRMQTDFGLGGTVGDVWIR